jgi:hypothetical protein
MTPTRTHRATQRGFHLLGPDENPAGLQTSAERADTPRVEAETLLALLAEERVALENLLFRLVEERLLLASGTPRWLNRAIAEATEAADTLSAVSKRRGDAANLLAAEMGIHSASPTLADLADAMESRQPVSIGAGSGSTAPGGAAPPGASPGSAGRRGWSAASEGSVARDLRHARELLRGLVSEVDRVVAENRALSVQGLASTSDAMAILGAAPSYDAKGTAKPQRQLAALVDARA